MDSPNTPLLRLINSHYNEIESIYHDIAQRLGLSDSSCKILYAIVESGNSLPLHDVAITSGLPKQTISSALRKLELEGLISLDQINGKAKRVRLTPAGETLADQTVRQLMDIENDIYKTWTQDEIHTYLNLSERFIHLIREKMSALPQRSTP